MQRIDKDLLDSMLELIRDYHSQRFLGEEAMREHCSRIIDKAYEIEAACGLHWNGIYEFCCGILMGGGVKEEACNEEVYRALGLLGWKVCRLRRVKAAVKRAEETDCHGRTDGGTDECMM